MAVGQQTTTPDFTDLAAEIVSAYVTKNSVRPGDLPSLIVDIHKALSSTHAGTVELKQEPLTPAVNPKKSVQPDYIICLEDGKKVQVTEAAPEHSLRPVARAIPREMGSAARLSHGRAELR
jgi:predicted transcriptional regulator